MSLFLKHTYKERPSKDHSNWLKASSKYLQKARFAQFTSQQDMFTGSSAATVLSKWTQSDFSNIGQWEKELTVATVFPKPLPRHCAGTV